MNVIVRNNFFLSQDLYGEKLTIRIEGQGFFYDHGEIVDVNQKRFSKGGSAYRSWSNHRCYTKTRGYPNWSINYIKNNKRTCRSLLLYTRFSAAYCFNFIFF